MRPAGLAIVMLAYLSGAPAAQGPAVTQAFPGSLPATFAGTLPCADCPGIRYQLNLFPDRTFELRTSYLERDAISDDVGRWALASDGSAIVLRGASGMSRMFSARDRDTLTLLDAQGEAFDSKLDYDLKRAASVEGLGPRLRVSGMYRYMFDTGLFTECATGREMTVATEGDNAALESAYTRARKETGQAMKILVDGYLTTRPNPDTGVARRALVVDRFVSVSPGQACAAPFAAAPVEKTRWRATQLAGAPVAASEPKREAHLVLEGGRIVGSDGCNRVTGRYELDGNAVRFGQVAGTRMACPDTGNIPRRFGTVLMSARRWRVLGSWLDFYDAAGRRLARFEARS
jgi:copper homeostasis protein (lipoprotein)